MSYDTSVRDAAVLRERKRQEEIRREVFDATRAALAGLAQEFGIRKTYLFGSLIREGAFRPESDVDILVEGCADTLRLAARLSRLINREVHVVEGGLTPVAQRARREGIEWTPAS